MLKYSRGDCTPKSDEIRPLPPNFINTKGTGCHLKDVLRHTIIL
jgi:hypothetical protein